MTAPVIDYLAASSSSEPQPALTPNSTAADAAGLVEIMRLITDPSAHQKMLAEHQQIKAAWAAIARERRELRRAAALQADELAKLRQEFDAAMATDKANQQAENAREKAALAATTAEFLALLDSMPRWTTDAN